MHCSLFSRWELFSEGKILWFTRLVIPMIRIGEVLLYKFSSLTNPNMTAKRKVELKRSCLKVNNFENMIKNSYFVLTNYSFTFCLYDVFLSLLSGGNLCNIYLLCISGMSTMPMFSALSSRSERQSKFPECAARCTGVCCWTESCTHTDAPHLNKSCTHWVWPGEKAMF